MGLYIELKTTDFYQETYGIDVNEMLLNVLREYNLETQEQSLQNKVPIIIQSFYLSSIQYFKQNTDLPTAFLLTIKGYHDYSVS